jgi:hypothetical protein
MLSISFFDKFANRATKCYFLRMSEPLKQELETYERLKESLLSEEGNYAVISGTELLGTYTSYEDALKIGYEKCGLKSFLVKKIQAIEPVNFYTRDLCLI